MYAFNPVNPIWGQQGRSQDFFRGTHNFPNSVVNNCTPPPPPPIKTVATQGRSQTEFHDRRGNLARAELLGGLGGMLPQKILKPRGSEMLFSASFMRYFFKNLISSKCKIRVVFGNLDSLVGRMTLIPQVESGD